MRRALLTGLCVAFGWVVSVVGAGQEPAGALPPLEHQIRWAATIVLADTEVSGGAASYRVRAVWKGGTGAIQAGQSLRLNTRMHELLGYRPAAGQRVVLFLTDGGEPLEVLPEVAGRVLYAPGDASVREDLTLTALLERVTKAAGASFRE